MIQIDIPMPTTCGECRFSDCVTREYPYCRALQQDRGYHFDVRRKRFPNCPLKPVQEKQESTEDDKKNDMLRILFNRCRAVGSGEGTLCVFCGIRKACDELHSI